MIEKGLILSIPCMKRRLKSIDQVVETSYLYKMIRIKSLLVFFDSEIRATDEELTFLYDYFFSLTSGGNYELELFSTISTLFPLPLYFKYSREMLQRRIY